MRTQLQKLKNAIAFTNIYKSYPNDKYMREAKCLAFQFIACMEDIDDKDYIAGKLEHDYVGFSSQTGGIYTYYFHEHDFLNALEQLTPSLEQDMIYELQAVMEYWKLENTYHKLENRFIHTHGYIPGTNYMCAGIANCGARIAGTNVDFHKLMRLGLPGLKQEIQEQMKQKGKLPFYEALLDYINTLVNVCVIYQKQAITKADTCTTEMDKRRFLNMAEALHAIQNEKPKSFLEGIQLMWIYSVCNDIMNYARMDDYLGFLYAQDIASGALTEEESIRYILGLYKHFKEIDKVHDCRVIIGGKGRQYAKEADALAIQIMEASRRFKETVPQLTLRCHKGMSEDVFQKAMEVNMEGCTFPILYSDETNIPAVMECYDVSEEEAMQYVPFGCGEYVLVGMSLGTPNNGVNVLKALEVTLHNGVDAYHRVACGIPTGELKNFQDFDTLYAAVFMQLYKPLRDLAHHKMLNYEVAGEEASFLHLSLLMDDCIAKGKGLLEGGVRYLNAASEIFGIISCADSLTAIKKLVFEEHRFTLEELVRMLDVNFEGYEQMRKLLQDAPKYGNDDAYADTMATRLFHDIARCTSALGEEVGLHKYKIVSVNNSMSAEWGHYCEASACGRKRGDAMSNGNGASIGADKQGITALLNSMAKFDHRTHVGVINNIRLSKAFMASNMEQVKAILKTYLYNNGVQLNLCVVGAEELQEAMLHPENYQNLMVRIGGFSARFVTLNPVVQQEIIDRTTYGG